MALQSQRQKQRLWKQYIKTNDTSTYVKFRKVSSQLRHLARKSVKTPKITLKSFRNM